MASRPKRGTARGANTNPFMVTSNECYGLALHALDKINDSSPIKEGQRKCTNNDTTSSHNLSFLMSRESDQFGQGTSYSDSALSKVFRQKDSDPMSKRRKNSIFAKPFISESHTAKPVSKAVSKDEVKEILSNYKHNPKMQNPLYVTEANEFGLRKPTDAGFTTARYGLSQKFSQSFNRTMFRDEGLVASMTKSKIHDQLTPQFI